MVHSLLESRLASEDFQPAQIAPTTARLACTIVAVFSFCLLLPALAVADLPPSPKDWTLEILKDELGSELKKNPEDNRWEILGKDFWRHVPGPFREMKGARSTYNLGCVGISDLFSGNRWGWPPDIFDHCYFDEAKALEKMKNFECPEGYTPNIIAIRFWDHNKAHNDKTPVEADGRVPNAKERFDEGEARSDDDINFDFGYRLKDGGYIHADHGEPEDPSDPPMKVKVSKDADTYNLSGGYPGFNSLLFCVTCVADLSTEESTRKFKEANRDQFPAESTPQQD